MVLTKEDEEIRVIILKNQVCGTVIGSSNGIVGVHLDTGEYIDVRQEELSLIKQHRKKGIASRSMKP